MPGRSFFRLLGLFFLTGLFLFTQAEAQSGPNQPEILDLESEYQKMIDLTQAGRLEEAISAGQTLEGRYAERFGTDSIEIANLLGFLGELDKNLGHYDAALRLETRVLEIQQKRLPPNSPQIGNTLNALGLLRYYLGSPLRAVEDYQKALGIYSEMGSDNELHQASVFNNLAEAYRALGDFDTSRQYYDRALSVYEQKLGPDHPYVGVTLNNLGLLETDRGALDLAESLLDRALAIRRKSLGSDHPDTAATMNNLALVHFDRGAYRKAEGLFQQALEIRRKAFGGKHPETSANLNNLALVKDALGEYAQAEALYHEAFSLRKENLGPNHPLTARVMANLAAHAVLQGDFRMAFDRLAQVQVMSADLVDQVMGLESDQRKISFLLTQKADLEALMALTAQHLPQAVECQRQAFDFWLRRKGLVLEAQKKFQEALVNSDDPEVWTTFQQLQEARNHLASLAFQGPGPEDRVGYQDEMTAWSKKKDALEARLSGLSRTFAQNRKQQKADTRSVGRALPSGAVLVDFALIRTFDFHDRTRWLAARYLAFVMGAGETASVRLIDLGQAEIIDQTMSHFKEALQDLTPAGAKRAEALSRRLYDLVLGPLRQDPDFASLVFISPDGNLNLLPFEVLTAPNGRRAIEDHTFIYLNTGRDLLSFPAQSRGQAPQRAVLFGAPDFDLPLDQARAVLGQLGIEKEPDRNGFSLPDALRGLAFSPLPGAEEEILQVARVWGREESQILTGPQAQKAVLFQEVRSPEILHLATHGFFLSDVEYDFLLHRDRAPMVSNEKESASTHNPLLRSGLALSGANRTLSGEEGLGLNPGILTAEEALNLHLDGTRLVVLSACQTGLGEIQAGQGVYGLRRAFIQAGTEGLVMSMWPVPDVETQEMMVAFYKNLKPGKVNLAQALRRAILDEKKTVQQRYGQDYPLLWGAFVFLGRP